MTDIKSMTIDELKELMTQIGEKPFRAKQIYSWLHEHLVTSYDEMANLPKNLKQKLADYPITALETLDVQISKVDGTRKYLFRLSDGNMIESVRLYFISGGMPYGMSFLCIYDWRPDQKPSSVRDAGSDLPHSDIYWRTYLQCSGNGDR